MFALTKPSEEEIISNSVPNTLYQHRLSQGSFFYIVHEDVQTDSTEYIIQLAPKTQIKVFYSHRSNEIRKLEITKITNGIKKDKVSLKISCLEQLKAFLNLINEIDVNDYPEEKSKHPFVASFSNNVERLEAIESILNVEDSEALLKAVLENGNITSHDIVSTGYRKSQLEIFRMLLDENHIADYKKNTLNKPFTKDETAWQEFFNLNQWIFGYGLDYRFKGILQKEFHASDTDAAGKDGVISDFLLGDKRFTSFVEIKLPTTTLFKKSQNRSGCWKLSSELLDAYSQILEQKACGEIKVEQKELFDEYGGAITQSAYDSKTFLIIGSLTDLEGGNYSDKEKRIKLKTFELFRRDSRNVEIITYDELYERAKFIVEHNS